MVENCALQALKPMFLCLTLKKIVAAVQKPQFLSEELGLKYNILPSCADAAENVR
jgi:hypothetical protein